MSEALLTEARGAVDEAVRRRLAELRETLKQVNLQLADGRPDAMLAEVEAELEELRAGVDSARAERQRLQAQLRPLRNRR